MDVYILNFLIQRMQKFRILNLRSNIFNISIRFKKLRLRHLCIIFQLAEDIKLRCNKQFTQLKVVNVKKQVVNGTNYFLKVMFQLFHFQKLTDLDFILKFHFLYKEFHFL